MNKKLLTLAVAAALAAPAIASAEAILYGKVHVSLDYAEVTNQKFLDPETGEEVFIRGTTRYAPTTLIENDDGTFTLRRNVGEDFDGWGMSSSGYIPGEGRASRLGVKGSEDLGNGLKAIYQVELGINLNDTNNNVLSNSDSITYRNSFVGLAGNWGTLLGGRHDTPMKISSSKLDLFVDTMADYNGTVGFRDLRADNAIAYISPNWSGFQLAAAIIPSGGATGGGQGLNIEESDLASTYSIAAIYSNGPFYASAAFENLYNEHFNNQARALAGNNCPVQTPAADERDPTDPFAVSCAYQDGDAQAYRFGLGLLNWNGFSLTAIYENQDQFFNDRYAGFTDPTNPANSYLIPGGPSEADLWQIQAGYAFGNMMVKAMYGQSEYSGDDLVLGGDWVSRNGGPEYLELTQKGSEYDVSTWAVGFDYNFSKRTTAYALYTDVDSDLDEITTGASWSGFSIGMMHSF